jgi:diacylglycerol kinase family enzyme
MEKILVVHNQASGNHKASLLRKTLDSYFDTSEFSYKLHEMNEGDSVEAVVREHVENGYGMVIAAGGDGTISGVAGGLVNKSVPLGIIPVGTGNMIAR